MTKSATRKKQKNKAAETKFRTVEQQLRGAVGVKNMSKFNPTRADPFVNKPDDASKARTMKEQEQVRGERFIAPTKGKIISNFGKSLGVGAGSVDRKTGKQIVSEDRDIPTRSQEKERAKLAKEFRMGGKVDLGNYKGQF